MQVPVHHEPVHHEQDSYEDFVRSHHGPTVIEPVNSEFSYGDTSVTPMVSNKERDVAPPGVMRDDPFGMDFGA